MSTNRAVFKILVVGEKNVGKTTLIRRYVDGKFMDVAMATIGVDFSLKTVELDKEAGASENELTLQIWDIAGENRFRAILPSYIVGTEGVILAFDATEDETLEKLDEWIEILNKHSQKELLFILISTKNDIVNFNKQNLIKKFKEVHPDIKFYLPTSSKTGLNVEEIFKILGSLISKRYSL